MTEFTQYIPDEGTMLRFGKKLAEVLINNRKIMPLCFILNGDLGAWENHPDSWNGARFG